MTEPEDDEFDAAAMRLIKHLGRHTNENKSASTITVNAGGVGVWIATTCCLVMLGCGLIGALWVSREFSRYDAEIGLLKARDNTQAAYLQSIWRNIPELKPKDEANVKKED